HEQADEQHGRYRAQPIEVHRHDAVFGPRSAHPDHLLRSQVRGNERKAGDPYGNRAAGRQKVFTGGNLALDEPADAQNKGEVESEDGVIDWCECQARRPQENVFKPNTLYKHKSDQYNPRQMWPQNYSPVGGSLLWSTAVAALPILVLLFAIVIARVSAWKASVIGLGAALIVAIAGYRMPVHLALSATAYGGAFGAFPIFWIVYWAIVLYRLTVETGKLEVLKDTIGHLTSDRPLQALLIAFAFGAFLEGAAGFGTPVAVAAAILAGLGFRPFFAATICLLANTAPVAFGSIGIPLVTLNATTGIPLGHLSANVGRLVAPVSLFIPAYLVLVMGGRKELRRVWPAAAVCGLSFAAVQFT